jgi:hypothetical protein
MSSFSSGLLLVLLGCGVTSAHVVSISNGELHINGRNGTYELRMPSYEVEKLANPETTLLDEIGFAGAKRTSSECKPDAGWLVCHAQYEFAEEPADKIDVECTLYRVTVPNHVHILYAVKGQNSDQKVFDQNTSSAEMRFHPPSFWESVSRDGGAGVLRVLKSAAGLLFLAAIALAARSWKEALLLGAMLCAAEWAIRPLVPFIPIGLSPEFLEAMMALTAVYLAGELVFLPDGRARWIAVPLFGLIHGLPFAGFPPIFGAGAMAAQVAVFAGLVAVCLRMPQSWRKPAAWVVFAAGFAWFTRFVVRSA